MLLDDNAIAAILERPAGHDFTQRQLMACLILRAYLKTTYRGVLELLSVSPQLRAVLGLGEKLPHYTTLQKFSARSRVLAIADAMIRTIGRAAGEPKFAKTSAAMDATGMETTTASAHFQSRAGRTRRKWVKVSTIVLCRSLLPLSLVLGWGPGNDKCQARELMVKASKASTSGNLAGRYACQKQIMQDNQNMSAFEIIEQIKELPANEQMRVAKFIAENGSSLTSRKYSVGTEGDGLPVIRANGGSITSQLVHEIESRTP